MTAPLTKLGRILRGLDHPEVPEPVADALLALVKAAQEVSRATSGKVDREQFAKPARLALAGLDGALGQLERAERLEREMMREGRG